MGAVNTTYTFTATDTITSTKMNDIIDQTTITTDAIIGNTLEVASGKLKVRALGITSNEIANGQVTSDKILDGTIVNADINASAAIELSKLATGALPTAITIASANIVDGTIATADLANAIITAPKLDGAQSGSAPIFGVRAWVNFNGQANSDLGGTYDRNASTSVTITATAHGLIAGNRVFLDFTVGTGTAPFDGIYEVASSPAPTENTFSVVSNVSTSSTGTVLLKRKVIRASGNASCVSAAQSSPPAGPPTSNQTPDNGYYIVNFSTAMPNTNFATLGSVNENGTLTASAGNRILGAFAFNEKCSYITTISGGGTAVDCLHNNITVIG